MPELIEQIDAIARRKKCDLIFISFRDAKKSLFESTQLIESRAYKKRRATLTAWLDENALSRKLVSYVRIELANRKSISTF